jgi:hypothetical protein
VLARQASVVDAGTGRPVDLREDLDALAALARQCLAEDRLRGCRGVDVSRVEGRDAVVEGSAYARLRGVSLDLAAVGDPVAVDELADLEAAVAQASMTS